MPNPPPPHTHTTMPVRWAEERCAAPSLRRSTIPRGLFGRRSNAEFANRGQWPLLRLTFLGVPPPPPRPPPLRRRPRLRPTAPVLLSSLGPPLLWGTMYVWAQCVGGGGGARGWGMSVPLVTARVTARRVCQWAAVERSSARHLDWVWMCSGAMAVVAPPQGYPDEPQHSPKGPPTATRHQTPTANRQPPTANRQPPPEANRQPPPDANRHPPPATRRQPPTANCQRPTATRRQPPTGPPNYRSTFFLWFCVLMS